MRAVFEFIAAALALLVSLFKKRDEGAARARITRLVDRRLRQKDRLERLKQRTTKSGIVPSNK